jgi:hypothetical protein
MTYDSLRVKPCRQRLRNSNFRVVKRQVSSRPGLQLITVGDVKKLGPVNASFAAKIAWIL